MCPTPGLPPVGGGLVSESGDGGLEADGEGPGVLALGGHEGVSEGDRGA